MVLINIPETPVIVAGGLGGPAVMLAVTPFRNGLTLGSTNTSLGVLGLYRQVFAKGLRGAWTGGIYPAAAACPQFLALGPAYHFYASFLGVSGGVVMTAVTESAVIYGAETRNAQMATNQKAPGTFKTLQPAYKPFGPGLSLSILRNVIATSGMRIVCGPCTRTLEKATGKSNALISFGGDLWANVISACFSAPVHQAYGFAVTTPEFKDLSSNQKCTRIIQFLKDQYLQTKDGKTRLSSVVPRDLFMRSMYIGTALAAYTTIERTMVQYWPR